mgnify:CR=1 FL=1
MVDRALELGMTSMAITDHGTLSGAIEFYKEATSKGIKPIIGMETYVASRKHTDKDPAKDKGRFHLILLAMNNTGYENLMRLSTIANLDGFYHKPRVDHDLLEKYNEGLIVLSGCIGGEVSDSYRNGQDEAAEETAKWYKSVFGDRYYFEIQDHGHKWAEQKMVNDKLLALSKKLDIQCVVTCDAHYSTHEDQEAHEILLCVQTGAFLTDTDRMSLTDTDLYLTDPKDVIERWGATPELISNTAAIAARCEVTIEIGKILIPTFVTPEGETEKTVLITNVYRGLAWRYNKVPEAETLKLSADDIKKTLSKEVLERAEFELGVIDTMGFCGYFLIVSDFIGWGKDQGIVFGPGRGSAAGSIVSYALKITDLDPIAHELLFERFLNPDRISMPDIDIDIQDTRRDEVIRYCVDKYGQERVANIVTFGTMAARNAIRDVARVLQVPYADADFLAKLVPPPIQGRHIPLKVSVHEDPTLRHEYESNETAKRVIDLAIKMEGTIRSHGVHAAGVVIAPDELVKFAPLEMAQKGVVTTQYSMGIVEDLGLLKMDFLGLSNLTIIKNALRIIKRVHDVDININALPLDDQPTFDLLGRGETTGVFQLESSGMKRYLRELKPTVFDDVIAMVALYRPGPLTAGLTQKFIDRKNGREAVTYEHEKMKSALGGTYGVLVYQEQVMQIAKDLSGFTGGQADTLRKAIGKKKRDVMDKMKKDFVNGAVELSGAKKDFVERFWKDLEGFADYAFNKSHAACYALISYWTAYLKAHYPAAFMAALMTSDYDDSDRLAIEISECKTMGLTVLPPDINQSFSEFATVPGTNQVRFGLAAIKNVGVGAVELLVAEREANGEFSSLEDFLKRVSTRVVNRKVWESLIKAGAFDRFGDRSDLLFNLDDMLGFGNRYQKDIASGQIDLFGSAGPGVVIETSHLVLKKNPAPVEQKEWLQWERELLGIYLSSHPLEAYEVFLLEQTHPIGKLDATMDGKPVTIGGIISVVREITTKKGDKMAFVTVADMMSELEVIVFPRVYTETPELWVPDKVVLIKGKLNCKDRDGRLTQEVKLLVDEASEITPELITNYAPTGRVRKAPKGTVVVEEEPTQLTPKTLYMQIPSIEDQAKLGAIKSLLEKHPGTQQAVVVIGTDASKRAVKLPFGITIDPSVTADLEVLLGKQCVALR